MYLRSMLGVNLFNSRHLNLSLFLISRERKTTELELKNHGLIQKTWFLVLNHKTTEAKKPRSLYKPSSCPKTSQLLATVRWRLVACDCMHAWLKFDDTWRYSNHESSHHCTNSKFILVRVHQELGGGALRVHQELGGGALRVHQDVGGGVVFIHRKSAGAKKPWFKSKTRFLV